MKTSKKCDRVKEKYISTCHQNEIWVQCQWHWLKYRLSFFKSYFAMNNQFSIVERQRTSKFTKTEHEAKDWQRTHFIDALKWCKSAYNKRACRNWSLFFQHTDTTALALSHFLSKNLSRYSTALFVVNEGYACYASFFMFISTSYWLPTNWLINFEIKYPKSIDLNFNVAWSNIRVMFRGWLINKL